MAERLLEVRQESGRLHVSGVLVPWNTPIKVGGVEESWRRGALDRQLSDAENRSRVGLDILHTSHAPAGHGDTHEPFGHLVDTANRRTGQWGDFRLDNSAEARMAWVLADDGILDAFSVTFVSIDPPHFEAGGRESRVGTRGQGLIREAMIDTVALTNTPAYKAARATAQARQRHPMLSTLPETTQRTDTVPPEYVQFFRNRQARRAQR